MTRFYGRIGYAARIFDRGNGIWEDEIIERPLYGDVVRNTRRLITGEDLNSDITIGNSISVVADAYALDNISAIRYVEWERTLWIVIEAEVQSPRLLLRLGGVYNGPTPTGTPSAPAASSG